MKELTVVYYVDDKEYARLEQLAENYRKQGTDLEPERLFQYLMTTGFYPDLRDRLACEERKLRAQNEN